MTEAEFTDALTARFAELTDGASISGIMVDTFDQGRDFGVMAYFDDVGLTRAFRWPVVEPGEAAVTDDVEPHLTEEHARLAAFLFADWLKAWRKRQAAERDQRKSA